jgi:hypothetical protein
MWLVNNRTLLDVASQLLNLLDVARQQPNRKMFLRSFGGKHALESDTGALSNMGWPGSPQFTLRQPPGT